MPTKETLEPAEDELSIGEPEEKERLTPEDMTEADKAESQVEEAEEAEETEAEKQVEETKEEEPEETEEIVVPVAVQEYRPELAEEGDDGATMWSQYTDRQRESVLRSVRAQIEQDEAGEAAEPDKPKEPVEQDSRPEATEVQAPSPPLAALLKELPTDEDITQIAEGFEFDADEGRDRKAKAVFQKALKAGPKALREVLEVGRLVAGALEDFRSDVGSVRGEQELQTALERHEPEMRARGFTSRRDYQAVARDAMEARTRGRVGSMMDAVSLVLMDRAQKSQKTGKAKSSLEKEAERIASNMAGKPKGAVTSSGPPDTDSVAELWNYFEKQLGSSKGD